jgi:3-hydroxyacyl-CoA dehydrogenase
MSTTPCVRFTLLGRIAIVTVDNPPVNTLTDEVSAGLFEAVERAEADEKVDGIVLNAAGRTFIAGADISTLEPMAWTADAPKPDLHPLLAKIEACRKPVVVAMHGTALGGGVELALAGHFRVALAGSRLGLPECALGIIPGAGGTQRLPRLAGVQKALDMLVTSKAISAEDAAAHGIVDEVVGGDLLAGAVAFLDRCLAAGGPYPVTSARHDRLGTPEANAPLFEAARALARRIKPQQPAALRAIEAVEAATQVPFESGIARETELFFEAVRTEPAKALIHLFFAERAVHRVPGLPRGDRQAAVHRVAIVGAGTMGGGIAMSCANAGLHVLLQDSSPESLDRAMQAIRRNYAVSVTRGRFTADQVEERLGRIRPQVDLSGFEQADLIIEAVFEDLTLKQQVLSALDRVARPGAILGTNTSTLDIDAIASATSRPSEVIGLHFFSPANVMRLLEIVRGAGTSPTTVAQSLQVAKALGKIGVVVGNGPGFVGNRMMFPYMYETQYMAEEGATPAQVDAALTEFGMAMGMFAVDDMAGIDVAIRVQEALGHFQDDHRRRPLVQAALVERGRLGQKTGKGWYSYGDDRKAVPDQEVVALIRERAREAGIVQREFTGAEIVERAIYALINEGARVLDEGLALRASDIDVIYVNGYGFPAWRGGPMFYADRVGLDRIASRISEFHRAFGERWRLAPLLDRLAREGRTFRDFDRR